MSTATRLAAAPFEFYTLARVTRSSDQSASTLSELRAALETCSDESIYHHTIAALQSQYAQSDKMVMNDYASWAFSGLGRPDLGEQLKTVDAREYETIAQIRETLLKTLFAYQQANPQAAHQSADKPFHICEGLDVRVPVDAMARNLAELRSCIERMSGESFYLHFVASRARLEQQSNDFSVWLRKSLGLHALAGKIDEIDVMESTLAQAKEKLLKLMDEASSAAG